MAGYDYFRGNMKYLLTLIFTLFTSGLTLASEPSCEITGYGIIGVKPESEVKVSNETTAIGSKNYLYGQVSFKETTRKIPAIIGTRFGVQHTFSNIPEGELLTTVITHPPMLSPKGRFETSSSIFTRPSDLATTYKLETEQELLNGKWHFQFKYHGALLCSKEFTLYSL